MVEVRIKDTQTVKPAEPSFNGIVPLTVLDIVGSLVPYITLIYFYKPNNEPSDEWSIISTTLRDSLSKTLVHFYPFSGRLIHHEDSRAVVVQCCGSTETDENGAVFIEAESTNEVSDFGDFSQLNMMKQLVPSIDKYGDRLKERSQIPLLLVQFTGFRCGGFSLTFVMSHIADGFSFCHFLREWARIARGAPLETPPFIDSTPALRLDMEGLRIPISNPECDIIINKVDQNPPKIEMSKFGKIRAAILPLTKMQVEKLKHIAETDDDDDNVASRRRPYSRYEVITSHVWRCFCKAKGYNDKTHDHHMITLGISADIRSRMNPSLPSEYFGNGVMRVPTTSPVEDIISNQLSYTCNKLRTTIDNITDEKIRSNIEHVRNLISKDTTLLSNGDYIANRVEGTQLKNDLFVANWLRLPLYDLDFGWGKEICMRPGPSNPNGSTLVMMDAVGNHRNDDGVINVVIWLLEDHMVHFVNRFYGDIN